MVADAVAGIDARIEFEWHLVPGVLDGNKTSREGEALQQNVVLKVEREIRTVESYFIMTERVGERFAQLSADDIFVAELGPNGVASQLPVEVCVEIDAKHVGAMIIEGNSLF